MDESEFMIQLAPVWRLRVRSSMIPRYFFDVGGRDVRAKQSLASQRQQMVQDQRRRAVTLTVYPAERGFEAMSGGAEEVQLRIVERHSLRDLAINLRNACHQSGEERRICDLINHGWTRRQCAILDSQMRDAVSHSVARAVPTPNCAVVCFLGKKAAAFRRARERETDFRPAE